MDSIKLGRTGLEVSRLCLGCMSFGIPERGKHAWTLGEEESRPFIKKALEFGINFFDTANVYSDGTSEEIVGRAIKDFPRRDDLCSRPRCSTGIDNLIVHGRVPAEIGRHCAIMLRSGRTSPLSKP